MKPVESPTAYLERNNPKHVRVYDTEGELFILRDPQLRGDTISGFEPLAREELSLTLSNVRRMEAAQPDKTRTTIFVGAMAVLGGAAIYMVANSSDGRGLICDSYDIQNRCIPRQSVGSKRPVSLPLLRF
jgi:hypothetical protein